MAKCPCGLLLIHLFHKLSESCSRQGPAPGDTTDLGGGESSGLGWPRPHEAHKLQPLLPGDALGSPEEGLLPSLLAKKPPPGAGQEWALGVGRAGEQPRRNNGNTGPAMGRSLPGREPA